MSTSDRRPRPPLLVQPPPLPTGAAEAFSAETVPPPLPGQRREVSFGVEDWEENLSALIRPVAVDSGKPVSTDWCESIGAVLHQHEDAVAAIRRAKNDATQRDANAHGRPENAGSGDVELSRLLHDPAARRGTTAFLVSLGCHVALLLLLAMLVISQPASKRPIVIELSMNASNAAAEVADSGGGAVEIAPAGADGAAAPAKAGPGAMAQADPGPAAPAEKMAAVAPAAGEPIAADVLAVEPPVERRSGLAALPPINPRSLVAAARETPSQDQPEPAAGERRGARLADVVGRGRRGAAGPPGNADGGGSEGDAAGGAAGVAAGGAARGAAMGGGELQRRLEKAGAGAGDVQISIGWNDINDIDLHVRYNDGTNRRTAYIYFGRPRDGGGWLDIDRNAAPPLIWQPIENVYWAENTAPPGFYEVGIHHFRNNGGPHGSKVFVRIRMRGIEKDIERTVTVFAGNPIVWLDAIPWQSPRGQPR
jgi:hypothetical protein